MDPHTVSSPVITSIVADRLQRNEDRGFLTQAQKGMRDWWELMNERGTSEDVPMKPQVPAHAVSEALASDAIVCGDSGTVTTWSARQIKVRKNSSTPFTRSHSGACIGCSSVYGISGHDLPLDPEDLAFRVVRAPAGGPHVTYRVAQRDLNPVVIRHRRSWLQLPLGNRPGHPPQRSAEDNSDIRSTSGKGGQGRVGQRDGWRPRHRRHASVIRPAPWTQLP
jgi:hypothetical protein